MPRGRTRDEDARRRVLDAAIELVGDRGTGTVTINDIVERAEVAKQTVYRWWPSRTAVILDALVERTLRATPFPDTDDVRADFADHLRAVAVLFSSPLGSLVREALAQAQSDAQIAAEFRERFWQPRRDLSLRRLNRAIDEGSVRADIDPETVLDAIYGPLWLQLLVHHRPLRPETADAIVDAVWPGIATADDRRG